MTTVDVGRDRGRDGAEERSRSARAKIITSTEARRAFVTTEFWITLLTAAALVIAGYVEDAHLAADHAWSLAAGVIGLYVLSRGIAKAGSRDPRIQNVDLD